MRAAIALIASVVVVGTITFISVEDAEACSVGPEFVTWTLPADDEVAPPNTRILLFVTGDIWSDRDITVTDEDGGQVDGEVVWDDMARLFSGYREFIPDEELPAGEYTVELDLSDDGGEEFEMTFAVDPSYDPPTVSEPVDFQWYRATWEEQTGDSCYWNDELNRVAVEPLGLQPHYYEIIFEHDDGSETIQFHNANDIDGELQSYEIGDVECVTVSAGVIDGTTSPPVQHCTPDKCKHHEDDDVYMWDTDWDAVSGCDEGEDNGDEEGDDNGEDEGEDNGDEEGDDNGEDEGDNEGEDNGEDEADSTDDEEDDEITDREGDQACMSVTDTAPSLFVLLFALGVLAFIRRRQRICPCNGKPSRGRR